MDFYNFVQVYSDILPSALQSILLETIDMVAAGVYMGFFFSHYGEGLNLPLAKTVLF